MLHVSEHRWVTTGSPTSRLQFEMDRGDRFLLIDGKRAYHFGFGCQTCSYLFERLWGANQAVQIEETAEALRKGVGSLDDEVVGVLGRGLPEGEYNLLLSEALVEQVVPGAENDYFKNEQPKLWGEDTFWCLPHDPRVSYFRAGDATTEQGKRLFNFIAPMMPTRWLEMTTIAAYKEELQTKASGTAVSIAVLDVRGPADWDDAQPPDPLEHWCLTHYLIDGHHKLNAAWETGKPLRMLTFVALSQGVSTREQIDSAVAFLSAGRSPHRS